MAKDTHYRLATRLLHAGERAELPTLRPTTTPIYTTTTFLHPTASELDRAFTDPEDYVYARHGNPTVTQLEVALATAEGGVGSVVYASGMAALHAALLGAATPKGGTHPEWRGGLLAARDLYGATTTMIDEFLAAQGVSVHTIDCCDLGAVDEAFESFRPDVLLVEQISNPLLRVVDVEALAQRAHAHGARLVVDNTIPSPIVQRPLELGADLSVHSATKYLGGHADVTAGAVVARTTLALDTLRRHSKLLGAILGPFAASQVSRGIKTLDLRVRAQCERALFLAEWLSGQPQIERVHYPGLPSHPQHPLAARAFNGLFGALITCELRAQKRTEVMAFMDALELILPGTSLGDIYTLVSAPFISSHRDLTPPQRAERGIPDGLIRLSVGIEDAVDLRADLARALSVLG